MLTCKSLGHYGRFGNQLYQIAGVIGIALRSNQNYCFPLWRNYDHIERFGSSEDCDLYKHLVNPLPEYRDIPYQDRPVGWGYHETLLPQGNWDLQGHFQSPRYFEHSIDYVREALKFTNEPELNNMCAIHWRAGDYDPDPTAYHPRMGPDYYREAMSKMPQGTRFLVFSDNMDEARKMFYGVDADYASGDYISDYKRMKSCKHFIIANSSFSSFAATMSTQEGVVVAPKKWFGPVAGITGDDVYCKNWIVI
jgi:hypothetical protein